MASTLSQASQHEASRAKRLKKLTEEIHEGVDRSIMSAASFANLERYERFLAVQYLFHNDIAALYEDARLQALFPDLAARRRFELVNSDLTDLHLDAPIATQPTFAYGATVDIPTALGWLYVAEGSNMGAAILRKEAAKLGLSDDHGARHLAPAPKGPAPHWRAFTAVLDSVTLNAVEEARVINGAIAAFARVQDHVDACLG